MRWWLVLLCLCTACFVIGCDGDETGTPSTPVISMLGFRYDAERDVVIASTNAFQPTRIAPPEYAVIIGPRPTMTQQLFTPQQYADALARLPDVNYLPSPAGVRFANPVATVTENSITVDYRDVAGLDGLASAQVTAIMAVVEGWWWVPGITQMRLLARGEPVTLLGPATMTQPMPRPFHTYVVQPFTGEVAYLVGSNNPANLAEAVDFIRNRAIRELPAAQGFSPLLPPDVTINVQTDQLRDGILPVDLSANFPMAESVRLAGMVLMLTQFPGVGAVQFTFGGQTLNQPFMRSNLRSPISPYDLLLPIAVARVAPPDLLAALQRSAGEAMGVQPASLGKGLVWQDWALLTVIPQKDQIAQTVIFHREDGNYIVKAYGDNLSLGQLLAHGMPHEAIVALRIPGWELTE